MTSTSKKFLEVILSEETDFSDEEATDRMQILEEELMSLTLVSKSQDDDHGRLFRKKARAKKVRDKWNQLVFVPMPVLNRRDRLTSGGKAGKREGFNVFNRLSCKPCGKCFHTAAGLSSHPCLSSADRPAQRSSFKSSTNPRPTFTKGKSPMVGWRRSSRATKADKSFEEEEDEIEIVGDTELERKNAERVDKNFSKMTLKGQREAMEAFKSSTEEEEEEADEDDEKEEVGKAQKVGKRGKKRKVVVQEDSDSDIEILDSPNEKRFSASGRDGSECNIGVEEEKEDMGRCVSITPMSKTSSNNNNKVSSSPIINTNKSNASKRTFKEELNSNQQKQDLIQVKSASGKTMMVERSKLERVMGETGNKASVQPLENQTSLLKRPNTRSRRALENSGEDEEAAKKKATIMLIDDAGQPEEEIEFLENSVDLKRKAAEGGDFLSRRLRRRG